jgi:tetratricopeptide (TPR) repeat protein
MKRLGMSIIIGCVAGQMLLQQASLCEEKQSNKSPPASTRQGDRPGTVDQWDGAVNPHHTWTMSQLQDALKKDPNSAELQTDLGRAYSLDGDVDQAMSILDKVISKNPRYARAYYLRAQMNTSDGKTQLAFPDFHKAVEFGSPVIQGAANDAMAHIHSGARQWKEAREEFDKVINSGLLTKQLQARTELDRAETALSTNKTEQGMAEIALALKDNPRLTYGYMRRALVYTNQNKIKQAIADYSSAIDIETNHETQVISDTICDCYRQRAKLYARIGRRDLAYRDWIAAKQYERDSMRSMPFRIYGK